MSLAILAFSSLATAQAGKCKTLYSANFEVPKRGKFKKEVQVIDLNNNLVKGYLIGRIDHGQTPQKKATSLEIADIKLIVDNAEYFLGNNAMTGTMTSSLARVVVGRSDFRALNNGPGAPAEYKGLFETPPSRTSPDGVRYLDLGLRFEAVETQNGQPLFRLKKIDSFNYELIFFNMYIFL